MRTIHLLIFSLFWLLCSAVAEATPFYAVGSAAACDTCHVEPLGWKNPKISDRRCTLDCKGCHVSPTGGGMRTGYGRFYGEHELPLWGDKPDKNVNHLRYLPKGAPTKGKYSLFEGFEGWWPGTIPHTDIDDRLGNIPADPKVMVGGDFRGMGIVEIEQGQNEAAVFPMEMQFYAAYMPTKNITLYTDVGMQGSEACDLANQDEAIADKCGGVIPWVRELFAMYDKLPYNGYVRAGRFALPFGWRIPDHSAFQRDFLFDQYRQGYGVEVGAAPNEGYLNLAVWKQGIEGWPGDFQSPGAGVSAQGGVRFLGFQVGGSLHYMKSGEEEERIAGTTWALNLFPTVYLGELDFRSFVDTGVADNSIASYNEVQYQGKRGFTPKLRHEALVNDVGTGATTTKQRISAGVEINLYKYLQFDLSALKELGEGEPLEFYLQLHNWIL